MRAVAAATLLALAAAGCSPTLADRPPSLAELGIAPGDRPAAADPALATPGDLDQWWRHFGDQELSALIELGLAGNLDIKLAAARLKPAEAGRQRPGRARAAWVARRIAVAADIARAYCMLRARQALIANLGESLARQDEALAIIRFREDAKLVSRLDEDRAVAERARTAALLPGLRTMIAADIARLGVLTGQSPAALQDRLAAAAPIPVGPEAVPAPATSELFARRPDLVAATGAFGTVRRRASQREIAATEYKRTVLLALENARNARAAFDNARLHEDALGVALAAADGAAQQARQDYREGLADFTALQDAERARLAAADALILAKADRAIALVALYVAEGGGWTPDTPVPAATPAPDHRDE